MKTFIQDVWEVTEEYDRDSRHIAYYSTREAAMQHKGRSHYLSVYSRKLEIIVLDSFEEFKDQQTMKKKAEALAKLDPEEKKLLGLE